MQIRFILALSILLLKSFPGNSQNHYNENFLRYSNYIYKENIQTVLCHQRGVYNSQPIIELNNLNQIELTFDDLSGGYIELKYTIIHCDADWQPSENLSKLDYIDGMQEDFVNTYKSSFNTYKKYTHYKLYFPTQFMKPKIPGNYILKIYDATNEDNVYITQRFFVVDKKVSITGQVKQSTYAKYRDTRHEIDFSVDIGNLPVANAFDEIKVAVRQNQRWDNMITNLKPQYIKDKLLIYDYEEENTFEAGNEWRAFDLRSIRFNRTGVRKLYLDDSLYNAVLFTDEDRSYLTYTSKIDINGNRIIALENDADPEVEADYVNVHFSLQNLYKNDPEKDIYLFGALTNWEIQKEFKMKYDPGKRLYTMNHIFKQGYYNYEYVYYDDKTGKYDAGAFEGNHFQTENDYTIYVYYFDRFLNTYLLVGISELNSQVSGKKN